jgi:hypothetical protein
MPVRLCGTEGRLKVEIHIKILAYKLGKNKNILLSVKKLFFIYRHTYNLRNMNRTMVIEGAV